MAYLVVGSAPAFSNLCLSWVQDQLHLPHEYPTAADAWSGYSGRGFADSGAGEGDMVFFARAPINGNAGHVGIVQADGTFLSVLSNGQVVAAPIDQFAADNGAPVLGYISTSALHGGVPVSSAVPTFAGLADQLGIPQQGLQVLGLLGFMALAYEVID